MKITKKQLQQIIKEEVAKEINDLDVKVLFDTLIDYANNMNASPEIMEELEGMALRYGAVEPGGDFDKEAFVASGEMDTYDI